MYCTVGYLSVQPVHPIADIAMIFQWRHRGCSTDQVVQEQDHTVQTVQYC